MSVIYVREQGAYVRKNGNQLRVTLGKQELFSIPLANLDQLVLVGNVQITTPAATFLMRSSVDLVFMSTYGTVQGRAVKMGSKFAQLRHLQLRLCDDEARASAIARNIVLGKISNQRVILQRRSDGQVQPALNGMMNMMRSAEQSTSLDQLRGYEGKAAAYYFEGLRAFFPEGWGFKTREYYPPPDPINALLSFAYTLLRKDIEAKIQLVGLDPYLGFFHALGYNRPALALDLMEEFRPLIADTIVLALLNAGEVLLDDFERTGRSDLPVRMKDEAMHILLQAYEERMAEDVFHPMANGQTSYRRVLELQTRQMARVIQGETTNYQPVVMR